MKVPRYMAQIGELRRQILQSIDDQMSHAVLLLQEARGDEALAWRPTRRYRSQTWGQTIKLAVPVSSSSVMNVIPLAVPGRCLTRTSPATR